MVVTARELYGGMVNGSGAGSMDRQMAEVVAEKGGSEEVPPRYMLPYLT